MNYFHYHHHQLYVENVSVEEIIQQHGTPCYIYSHAALTQHWQAFDHAFSQHKHPHLICYAVKANSNLAVLQTLAKLGSGFDVVSIGELERVIKAGGDPQKVVFSGVGKQKQEISRALELGIYCFNVESAAELYRLQDISQQLGKRAPIALRINPDVEANTHPYIATGLKENKFGIDIALAKTLYLAAKDLSHIDIIGIDCHIGSQITDLHPFLTALDHLLALVATLANAGIHIQHLDLGGGLGVHYHTENPPQPTQLVAAICERLTEHKSLKVILEPGRAIAANAGILVTRVEYLKENRDKHFAIVDAGMNDLLRPALYHAWQNIIPVNETVSEDKQHQHYDIVGPVCETGDFLGKNRPLALASGDLLAILGAGAYGFSMSSNYNTRPRAIEIMINNNNIHVVRTRESVQQLWANEHLI